MLKLGSGDVSKLCSGADGAVPDGKFATSKMLMSCGKFLYGCEVFFERQCFQVSFLGFSIVSYLLLSVIKFAIAPKY